MTGGTGILVLLVLCAGATSGCSRCASAPAEAGFSCASLQERTRECGPTTLAIVKRGLEASRGEGGGNDAERQHKMFASRFERQLETEQMRKQCEKFSASAEPAYAKRLARMQSCYGRADCEAFAQCMLAL